MHKALQECRPGQCPFCKGTKVERYSSVAMTIGSYIRWCSHCKGTGLMPIKNLDLIRLYLEAAIYRHLQDLYINGRSVRPF